MANSLNTITVNGVTYDAATYSASTASSTTASSALDKETFLKLLVTQMEYQDPLDPQDNSEYLAELAQFSALEQMTNVADSLSSISSLVENMDTSLLVGQLSNMIGKEIQWQTSTTVTGDNGQSYENKTTLEGTIAGVSISDGSPTLVVNSDGNTYSVAISDITRVGSGS